MDRVDRNDRNGSADRRTIYSGLRCHCFCLPFAFLLLLAPCLRAQDVVAPCTSWLATVDEASQQILLTWHASADTQAMGYHICTGDPCLNYDTVFGRFDTSYRCLDHDPTVRHSYRLHVFDSAYNASELTPSFGNMVLSADVPQCATEVAASWTPYEGMPSDLAGYTLLVRLEPFMDDYEPYFATGADGPYAFQFDMAEGVTRVWLKVQAQSRPDPLSGHCLVSQSNVLMVERLTVDTADFLDITSVEYDSVRVCNILKFNIDTTYQVDRYTLLRSIDGSPWDAIADLDLLADNRPYVDNGINPYDSLHCYQLSVLDACGLNPRYSATRCVVVPDPPPPAAAFPNTVVVDDPVNGSFRPVLRGLKGNLYELRIYNRAGLLVFSSDDPDVAWTPSASTPQGVYAYNLRCRFNDNRVKSYTGTILVIK